MVGAAMVVALAIWALAHLLGVELTVGKGRTASPAGAPGVVVTVLLARRRAARWWPFVGGAALAISVSGSSWLDGGAAAVVLIGMHLAVGFALITGFSRPVPR